MNKISATITAIETHETLNIVEFEFNSIKFKMMSLELNSSIKIGKKVILTVKPTHVAVAKNFQGELSYSNQITSKIKEIEIGKLLSSIIVDFNDITLESIITASSAKRMELKKDDEITLLVKASDLSILEIIND